MPLGSIVVSMGIFVWQAGSHMRSGKELALVIVIANLVCLGAIGTLQVRIQRARLARIRASVAAATPTLGEREGPRAGLTWGGGPPPPATPSGRPSSVEVA